jgi:hypothetical protein
MARHYRLAQSASLFVEPGLYDAAKLGPSFSADCAAIEKLRSVLFAETVAATEASEPRHAAGSAATAPASPELATASAEPAAR